MKLSLSQFQALRWSEEGRSEIVAGARETPHVPVRPVPKN